MRKAYLDIETNYTGALSVPELFTDYVHHEITVIGIRVLSREEDSFVQLIGEEVTRESLVQALHGVERIVTYNGRSIPDKEKRRVGFDFPVIAARLGIVLDKEFPHDDLVPRCWKKNLYGGLKAVEATLGLRRKLPGKDGKWATEMWRNYVNTKDEPSLKLLLAYNREDVFMLYEVEKALEARG
jgi:uncharacterized protein YprB with RNaseH-like and TPR domain